MRRLALRTKRILVVCLALTVFLNGTLVTAASAATDQRMVSSGDENEIRGEVFRQLDSEISDDGSTPEQLPEGVENDQGSEGTGYGSPAAESVGANSGTDADIGASADEGVDTIEVPEEAADPNPDNDSATEADAGTDADAGQAADENTDAGQEQGEDPDNGENPDIDQDADENTDIDNEPDDSAGGSDTVSDNTPEGSVSDNDPEGSVSDNDPEGSVSDNDPDEGKSETDISGEDDGFSYQTPDQVPAGLVPVDAAFLQEHQGTGLSDEALGLEYPIYAYQKVNEDGSSQWSFCVYGTWEQVSGFYACDSIGKVGENPELLDSAAFVVTENEDQETDGSFLYEIPTEDVIPGSYIQLDADIAAAILQEVQELWAGEPEENRPALSIPETLFDLPYPVFLYIQCDEQGRPVEFLFRVYGTYDGVTGFYECDENGLVDPKAPKLCEEEGIQINLFAESGFHYLTPGEDVEIPYFYELIDADFLAEHTGGTKQDGYIEGLKESLLNLGYPVWAFDTFRDGEPTGDWQFRVFGVPAAAESEEEVAAQTGFYVCDKTGIVDMDQLELRTLEMDEAIRGKGKGGAWEPDSAIVKSLTYLHTPYTGVTPFDSENPEEGEHTCLTKDDITSAAHAGEDCCKYNEILRVGDLVTMSVMATTELNEDKESGTDQGRKYASLKGGTMYIEGTIPEVEGADFVWDTQSFSNVTITEVSPDGKYFKGSYTFLDNQDSVPGTAMLYLFMKLNGGKNGEEVTVQPVLKAWMDGNQYEDDSITEGVDRYEACTLEDPMNMVITAKSAYNIRLKQKAYSGDKICYPTATEVTEWDDLSEDLQVGDSTYIAYKNEFVLSVQMDSQDEAKGLLGYELPKGPIEYDLHIRVKDLTTGEYVTSKVQPVMRNAVGNGPNQVGDSYYSNNQVNGFWGKMSVADFKQDAIPISYSRSKSRDGQADDEIWNSGAYELRNGSGVMGSNNREFDVDEGTQIGTAHVKIEDYEVGRFPTKTAKKDDIPNSLGYLSLFTFEVVVPGYPGHTYQMELWDDSMDVTSFSGVEHKDGTLVNTDTDGVLTTTKDTSQIYTDDDRWATGYDIPSVGVDGTKDNQVERAEYGNIQWTLLGENIRFTSNYENRSTNIQAFQGQTIVNLSKFDGSLYQPTGRCMIRCNDTGVGLVDYQFDSAGNLINQPDWSKSKKQVDYVKFYWAAKPDGSNWSSYDEMEKASIADLVYYESLDAVKAAGAVCLGVAHVMAGDAMLKDNFMRYEVEPVNQTASNILGYDEMAGGGSKDPDAPLNIDFRNRTQITNRVVVWHERMTLEEVKPYLKGQDVGAPLWDGDRFTDPVRWEYEPTTYGKGGVILKSPYPVYTYYGKTFCILGLESKVRMYLDNEQSTYNINQGQSQVPVRIEPSIAIDQKTQNDTMFGKDSFTDVTVTVTLPKGTSYVGGSGCLGGSYDKGADKVKGAALAEPEITRNDQGEYVLTWIYEKVNFGQKLEPIHYRIQIDPDISSKTDFKAKVVISCPEDARPVYEDKGAYNCRYWDVGFQAIVTAESRLYEVNRPNYVDVEKELGWDLVYMNSSDKLEWKDMRLYSLLPQDGDWRGSHFGGDYTLADISVELPQGSAKGLQLYYTTDTGLTGAEDENDFFDRASADGVVWIPVGEKIEGSLDKNSGKQLLAAAGSIPKEATAICLGADHVGTATKCVLELNLRPKGNQAYDVYISSCSIRSGQWGEDSNGLVRVISSTAQVGVLQRLLSGLVFIDGNHDGIRSLTQSSDIKDQYLAPDSLVEGAVVSLEQYDEASGAYKPAVDVTGKTVAPVTTGANGRYSFGNLAAGSYRVKIESELLPYLEVTKYRQGNNRAVDSDATEETGEQARDAYAYIENIEMPDAADILAQKYEVKYQDAGLCGTGEIRVDKRLILAENTGIEKEKEQFGIGLYDGSGKKKLAEAVLAYDAATDSYQKKNSDGSFEPLVFGGLTGSAYVIKELDELGNAIDGSGIYYYQPDGEADSAPIGKYETQVSPSKVELTAGQRSQTVTVTNQEPAACLLALQKQVTGYDEDPTGESFSAVIKGRFYKVEQDGTVKRNETEETTKTVVFRKQADGSYVTTGADLSQYSVTEQESAANGQGTVPGLILGETYQVQEVLEDMDPYTFVSMELVGTQNRKSTDNSMKVTAAAQLQTVIITNTRNASDKELTIKKTFDYDGKETLYFVVSGPIPAADAAPGIRVTQHNNKGERDITAQTVIDRVAGTIMIPYDKERGSLRISGLYADAVYTVSERADGSYTSGIGSVKNPKGSLASGTDAVKEAANTAAVVPGGTVTFQNARNSEGSIVICKSFVDGCDDGKKLTFRITGSMPEKVKVNGEERVPEKTGKNGSLMVTMGADRGDITVTGLYEGALYQVTEEKAEGYEPVSPQKVTAKHADSQDREACIAAFENKKETTGSLQIRKKIQGKDGGETFRFAITGKLPEQVAVQGKKTETMLQEDGSRKLIVDLTAKDREKGITITGLYQGEKLVITELQEESGNYQVNRERFRVTVEKAKTVKVTFTNIRKPEPEPEPEPDPDPVNPPDPPTPVNPPDPPTPVTPPDPPTPVIPPDPPTPVNPQTLTELSEPAPPLARLKRLGLGLVEILDEEVPLAAFFIKTGDGANTAGYLSMLIAALAALAVTCTEKKKKQEK